MATKTGGQGHGLKTPSHERPNKISAGRIIAGGWRRAGYWVRYLRFGTSKGVSPLVDFLCGNSFIPAYQQKDELRAFGEILAAQSPESALEIGTYFGGTLFFLTRLASPHATIISVDLPGGKFGGKYSPLRAWTYKRFARRRQRLEILQGDSHSLEMLNCVKGVLAGQPLDYLFIDGDHTYGGVKRDFDQYACLVRGGGIIAMHDIAEHSPESGCDVFRFWNEIKLQYRHREIINDPKQGWAGIGVLYVD